MTLEIAILLAIAAAALVLFALEWFSADIVGLGVMVALTLTGLLSPRQALAGFGSDVVLLILGLLIMAAALIRTGAVDAIVAVVHRLTAARPSRLLPVFLVLGALLSAFINNTAAMALLLPVVIGAARRARVPAASLLMPVAFAVVLASSLTLFATSTNIVVSGLLVRYDLEPIGVFELTPVGVPIAIAGIAYVLTLGRRLMPIRGDADGASADRRLVEVILLPRSPLIGTTAREQRLRERFHIDLLGIRSRPGIPPSGDRLADCRLRLGDVLLIGGPSGEIAAHNESLFQALGELEEVGRSRRGTVTAVAIFAVTVALATTAILEPAIAVLAGVVAMFATRCIAPEQAYRDVEWRAILLIGSMLSLGIAIEETGAAKLLAGEIIGAVGGSSPVVLLSVFFGLTVLLTQPMSNQAAAIVMLPIAVQSALMLGWDPRSFAVMIAIAASTSFLTPLEPACLIVYRPGRYRFFDFLRVGGPLTVVVYIIAIAMVPVLWPPRG